MQNREIGCNNGGIRHGCRTGYGSGPGCRRDPAGALARVVGQPHVVPAGRWSGCRSVMRLGCSTGRRTRPLDALRDEPAEMRAAERASLGCRAGSALEASGKFSNLPFHPLVLIVARRGLVAFPVQPAWGASRRGTPGTGSTGTDHYVRDIALQIHQFGRRADGRPLLKFLEPARSAFSSVSGARPDARRASGREAPAGVRVGGRRRSHGRRTRSAPHQRLLSLNRFFPMVDKSRSNRITTGERSDAATLPSFRPYDARKELGGKVEDRRC